MQCPAFPTRSVTAKITTASGNRNHHWADDQYCFLYQVEPEKIAHMLDRLYTRFDALSCHYGVFKVETIGGIGLRSCYAMSGMREPRPG